MSPFRNLANIVVLVLAAMAGAQAPMEQSHEVFGSSSCMGCHGQNAMGGLGPPLAKTKLTDAEFRRIVRAGKGMMPATPTGSMNDSDLESVYAEVKAKPWVPEEIPIAYKVGQFLSPKNVSHVFLAAFLFLGVMMVYQITRWVQLAGFKQLKPGIAKFGWGKAAGIVLKSLIVDGFLVGSLWQSCKKRWLMHGLLIYGFCGLILADILMAINNPQRGQLPLTDPLKMLPMLSGMAVFIGVCYVMYRYKRDEYIDNGLTLGRDFLFVQLLLHVAFSGFLVVALKRAGVHDWVMTAYIYHLVSVLGLVVSGPFTRFQHMYIVPTMAAMTRLTEALTVAGVDIGFDREPSPGRHHKTLKIAENVMDQLGEGYADQPVVIRYYP